MRQFPIRAVVRHPVGRSTGLAVLALAVSVQLVIAATVGAAVTASRLSPYPACPAGISATGTNYPNAEVEPWVAVNPTDANNVVGVWQQDRWTDGGSHSNDTAVSTTGGSTWAYPAMIPWSVCSGSTESRYARATDPWVSFGPTGTAHAIALSLDPNGFTTAVLASRSTNKGATWSAPAVLIDDNDLRFFNDKESITADPTNSNYVYAVWDRIYKPGQAKGFPAQVNSFAFRGFPYLARSTDNGQTWEPARRISSNANQFTIGNQVAVLPDGTLLDFTDYSTGSGVQPSNHDWKAVFRSTDHGVTWSKPITISQVTEARPTIPDGSFPIRVGGDDIAVDPTTGDVYAAWTDTRFNDGAHNDVIVSKSTDGGLTWSTPVKASKNPVGVAAFTPSIHVNSAGDVAISYYDFRNATAGPTVATDFWMEISSDGGSTWSESRLTSSSFDITTAPVAPASRGYFLGDYEGMTSAGTTFYNLYIVTTGVAANPTEAIFQKVTP